MPRSSRSSRRKRQGGSLSKANARSYSQMVGGSTAAPQTAPAQSPESGREKRTAPAATLRTSSTVDWANEYRQVFQDLKQLLLITAALFVVMVVLGFVL